MVATAVIGAVGSIGGALISSNAQKSAASAQRDAANQANATEQGFFNSTQGELQPFIDTGTNAANKLSSLEGLNGGTPSSMMSTLQGLPGYQFANQQGLKSVQNSATARGLGVSGAALKGAANYSTGLANEYYNNLLSGIQNTENTGEGAASSLGGVASNIGQSIGQNTIGAGQASAAGILGSGTAISNGIGGVSSSLITGNLLHNLSGSSSDSNYLGGIGNGISATPPDFSNGVGSGLSDQFNFGQIGGSTLSSLNPFE